MPDAAQFTLALFDSTGLGTSVQAPARVHAADAADLHGADAEPSPREPGPTTNGSNYVLDGDRALARGWAARARDNIAAIRLSKELELGPRTDARGAGATAALHGLRRDRTGPELLSAARSDGIPRRMGGDRRVLSKTPSRRRNMPPCSARRSTPTTRRRRSFGRCGARPSDWALPADACWNPAWAPACSSPCCPTHCALHAAHRHRIRSGHRPHRAPRPPRSPRAVRGLHAEQSGRALRPGDRQPAVLRSRGAGRSRHAALGLRLHDYFIARSIARLRPGGIALFVTSTGTMDKASTTAREHIAGMADLVGAVRLPEGSMRATAGTEVVIDVLVFQRRADGQAPRGPHGRTR